VLRGVPGGKASARSTWESVFASNLKGICIDQFKEEGGEYHDDERRVGS